MTQSIYLKIVESQTFDTQAEALAWGKTKKKEYTESDIPVKVDTNPIDATRRRWVTEVYAKT